MSTVNHRLEGSTGIIEINRPEAFNCLSQAVWQEIDAALKTCESNSSIRAIMLCGTGKHFCTGADLKEIKQFRGDKAALKSAIEYGMDVSKRLEASELPVIAAVQGLALAGGLELVSSCDIVFATKTAQLGDQHAQFGLVPGWGGSQRLPRLLGIRRALDLLFTARWLSADEAKNCGLVNYLVDEADLFNEAFSYCEKIATRSASGIAMMKKLAREGLDKSWNDSLDFELSLAIDHLLSDDVSEGLAAFEEKRDPKF